MQKLTAADLNAFMQEQEISGDMLHLTAPTPTVEKAAQAVGTHVEQIVKSILFLVGDQPVLAITSGTSRVDRRAIATLFAVGRKRVKLASADVVLEICGYEVGAMPPFGHLCKPLTLMDRRVLELSEVYAGGGAENVLIRIDPEVILRITQAQVMDLVENSTKADNEEGDQ